MSDVDLTHQQRGLLIKFCGAMIIAVVVLFITGLLSSWQTRVAIIETQRIGCERGKKDRADNADAWKEAVKARTRDGDLATAAIYQHTVDGLVERSKISCETTYPDPPFIKILGVSS